MTSFSRPMTCRLLGCGKSFMTSRKYRFYCCIEHSRKAKYIQTQAYFKKRYKLDPIFRRKFLDFNIKNYNKVKQSEREWKSLSKEEQLSIAQDFTTTYLKQLRGEDNATKSTQ